MKALLFCVLLFITLHTHASSVGKWSLVEVQSGTVPLERTNHACEVLNDKMYVFGGRTGLATWSNTLHTFNIASKHWEKENLELNVGSSKTSLPTLAGHSMTLLNNKFYIFGGRSGLLSYSREMYIFEAGHAEMTLVPIAAQSPRPEARTGHSSIAFNDQIIIFGGNNGNAPLNDLWLFDTDKNKWTALVAKGESPILEGHSVIVKNNKMYVFGGYNGQSFSAAIFVLDLETLTWSNLGNTGKKRAFHTATLIGNYVYITGGTIGTDSLEDVQIFDLTSNTWIEQKPAGDMGKRQGHCAISYQNKIYVFGGSSGWKAKFNDVHELNTYPEEESSITKENAEKPLSEQIEILIRKVNSFTDTAPENKTLLTTRTELEEKPIAQETMQAISEKIQKLKSLESLQKHYSEARKSIQAASSEVGSKIKEAETARKDFLSKRKELDELVGQMNSKLKALQALEKSVADARTDLNQAKERQDAAEQQVQNSRAEKQKAAVDIESKKRRIAELQNDLSPKQKALEFLKAKLKNFSSKDANSEKEHLEKIEKVREQIAMLQSQITTISEKIQDDTKKLLQVDTQLSKMDDINREARELKQKLEQTLKTRESYLRYKKNFITKLQTDLDKNESASTPSKLFDDDEELKWIESLLGGNTESLSKTRQELLQAISVNEEILKEQKQNLKDLKQKEFNLKIEMDKAINLISMKNAEKEELEKEVLSLQPTIQILESSIVSEKDELGKLEAKLQTTDKSLTDAINALEAAKKNVKSKERAENDIKRKREDEGFTIEQEAKKLSALYSKTQEKLFAVNKLNLSIETYETDFETKRLEVIKIKNALLDGFSSVDCEALKKRVEELTQQNAELKKQVEQLTTAKKSAPKAVEK